ncbi:conserved Plasmodium protein, unknown function [Plasmodium ovale wallikeri]|uniref:Uncharacterized protein n=2 Tax=Plasmodium ovale TaxID=36330 RepID=A0A1A8YQT1_PLAOA|nr:conserved Plasmodium protein, unknown function [Plasmodium ovale wallikeri]
MEKDGEKKKKKVNKKLMRRRLLKFYKMKRKNEGTEEDIFAKKEKYSIFDYVENKLKGSPVIYQTEDHNNDNTGSAHDSPMQYPSISTKSLFDTHSSIDGYTSNVTKTVQDEAKVQDMSECEKDKHVTEKKEETNYNGGNNLMHSDQNVDEGEVSTPPGKETKKKKKKLKKLKKNMHIGKYHRKIYTYKKKIAVQDIHNYVVNKQLRESYILKKDTLKNVFVNKPLFNFYNFYNFFQIDHIEKYNKEKILNLIYYYIYKYKNNVGNEIKYDFVKTNDVVQRYEHITDDQTKMNHYLEYYINMNNNKYLYMNIDKDFTLKKKKTDAFTVSNINKVDSLHIHNYKVVWTIRNVKEKLFWRYREMGNIPLTTSAFSFAGKKSFKLKIWLDGHKSAKKNYVSIGLKQLKNYSLLEEFICFSLNGITRGPFTYLSKEYYQSAYNFCKFDELNLENDELQLSLFVYDGIV